MTFEQLVIDARETTSRERCLGFMLRALEALAAERAEAGRVDQRLAASFRNIEIPPREPRSISHWGMFA